MKSNAPRQPGNKAVNWALAQQRWRTALRLETQAETTTPTQVNAISGSETTSLLEQIRKGGRFCPALRKLAEAGKIVQEEQLWWTNQTHTPIKRVVVPLAADNADPTRLRRRVLQMAHDEAQHPGFLSTLRSIEAGYWWPQLRKDVKQYTGSCKQCQRGKFSRKDWYGALSPIPSPDHPFSRIHLDFAGPLPHSREAVRPFTTKGWDRILLVVDALTRFVILIPARSTDTSWDTAQRLLNHAISLFGWPREIVSDQDSLLTSRFTRSLCKLAGINHLTTTVVHPEANGRAEARVKAVKERLQTVLAPGHKQEWARRLPAIQLALNSAVNSTTGCSPVFAMTGAQPADPLLLEIRAATTGLTENQDALQFLADRFSALLDIREHEAERQEQMRRYWTKKHPARDALKEGDFAYIAAEGLITKSATDRLALSQPWVGPCQIKRVAIPNVTVELPASHLGRTDTFHMKYVKPALMRDAAWDEPPLLATDGEGEHYEIDRILDVKGTMGHPAYLVSYKGYDPVLEAQWVSEIEAPALLEKFLRSVKEKKRLRKLSDILKKDSDARKILEEELRDDSDMSSVDEESGDDQ